MIISRYAKFCGAVALAGSVVMGSARAADFGNGAGSGGTSDFSGVYFGLDGGLGIGSAGSANTSGYLGGAHIGYNFQANRLVGGVEADAMLTNISTGKLTISSFNQKMLSSARVRAGYIFADLMAYGMIGYGFSTSSYLDISGVAHSTIGGLSFGAGGEYALTRNISLRGELVRYNFGQHSYATPLAFANLATSTNLVKAGINFRF